MRGLKLAAIAVAALILLILGFEAVGFIFHLIAYVAVAALVVGGVYVAFKLGRASNREVKGKGSKDHEVRDSYSAPSLPRTDVQPYTQPAPPAATRPVSSQNIDDELAKLKRQMGS
jgi:hypothetical protein